VVSFVPLFWKYAGIFLPHYRLDLPQRLVRDADRVERVVELWEDEASREEYVAQLRWMTSTEFGPLPAHPTADTYFPEEIFRPGAEEVFVDCGAFDGDTIRAFLQRQGSRFREIVALEPDPENYAKLARYVETLPADVRRKIELRQLAVGARRELVRFMAAGSVSSRVDGEGTVEVQCEPLDEILTGRSPSYVKMDIEGAEPQALAGARQTILGHHPALAVCVYHRQEHLWEIPLHLRDLWDGYRFFLRRHGDEFGDVVCYALPPASSCRVGPDRASERRPTNSAESTTVKSRRRECAVCGKSDGKKLFRQSFAAISGGSLLDGYNVVVCRNCGFAYADELPSQAEFDEYYGRMSKYEYQDESGKESPLELGRFRPIVAMIRRVCPSPDTRILDVGCSTGGLLALLKEEGYKNVRGLDPSPVCVQAAKRLYDIEVTNGAVGDCRFPSGSFDLLILSSVLEHLRDLRPILARLHELLAADGLLLVRVPDATRFADEDDAPFQQFSTEHVNFFSPASLTNLIASAGFSPVLCEQNEFQEGRGFTQVGQAVDAVFRKSESSGTPWSRDGQSEPALVEYLRKSREIDRRICRTIDTILAAGKPILVWGTGTHTLRLLATSRLREAPIAAFIDSNPRYQGKDVHGIPILAPADLAGRNEPILVSSRVFQEDIARQIREKLHLPNQVFTLYEL
jgi:FkbM family methyltransferase